MAVQDIVRKRIIQPALRLLRQGLTPERLSASIVAGTYCGFIPVPGVSTMVTTMTGLALRLNQPSMHFMNQLVGPVQIALLIPFIRLGEQVFSEVPLPLNIDQIIALFQADLMHGFDTLWTSLWHAVVAWMLAAPLVCGVLYMPLKPVVRVLLKRFGPAPVTTEIPAPPPA